MNERITDS